MSNTIQFKICISNDNKVKCSFFQQENKERIIKLHNQEDEYYDITLSFIDNKITFCSKDDENAIQFMSEWISEPEDFKLYTTVLRTPE